jgi:hypothetical protein
VAALPSVLGGYTPGQLAWDGARNRLMMLGGSRVVATTTATNSAYWLTAPNIWTGATAMPFQQFSPSAGFDPLRGTVVAATVSPANVQTAEFDGTNWTSSAGSCAGSFPLVWNPALGRLVGLQPTGDLCQWTGSWAPLYSAPTVLLPPASSQGVYDAIRKKTVLVTNNLSAQWEFDGATWSLVTATLPPSRTGFTLGWDPVSQRVILFGGHVAISLGAGVGGYNQSVNETWAWDGTTWSQVATSLAPPARSMAAVALDKSAGRLRLFGGCDLLSLNCTTVFNDLWEFTGTTWVQVTQPNPPPARIFPVLGYDTARARLVLTGGSASYAAGAPLLWDTWEFVGGSWTRGPDLPVHASTSYGAFDELLGDFVTQYAVSNGGTWAPTVSDPLSAWTSWWDPARGRLVSIDTAGRIQRERFLSADTGPAHVASFSCADLLMTNGWTRTSASVTFNSGGVSATGPGAAAQWWTGLAWLELARNQTPSASALSATITDPSTLGALCVDGKLTVQATTVGGSSYVTSGPNAALGTRAQLSTDYVELVVRTRIP